MKDNIFYSALEESLTSLPDRSKSIIRQRFGIDDNEAKTLDAIGKENNITRERVRQLVNVSIYQINESKSKDYERVQKIITDYIDSVGGIIFQERLLRYMSNNYSVNAGICNFYIHASEYVNSIQNNSKKPFSFAVFKKDFDFKKWNYVHDIVEKMLIKNDSVISFKDLKKEINNEVGDLSSDRIKEYLYISRSVMNNPFDEWGFKNWGEINPRGVRDKVFLVLKHTDKTMHFREIAKAIDECGLSGHNKSTHPQTVHNELIKDERFVLVGRGAYELASKNKIRSSKCCK